MSAEITLSPAEASDAVIVFAAEIEAATTLEMLELCRRHGPAPLVIDAATDPLFAAHAGDARTRDHFPLLCVRGALVGGLKVVRHLAAENRLHALLAGEATTLPTLAVSQGAAEVLARELSDPRQRIRIVITPAFEHQVSVDSQRPGDVELAIAGVTFVLDAESASRADGIAIEWMDGEVKGLRIDNPNRPMPVRVVDCAWLDSAGAEIDPLIIDARTAPEYQSFHLDGARLLDASLIDALTTLAHDTPLLFYCNGGIRSQKAATRYYELGFANVYCMREDPRSRAAK